MMSHKNSKLQTPSSKEVPNTKLQEFLVKLIWDLELGASLMFGAWCLELP
jgi:hypothetical protein